MKFSPIDLSNYLSSIRKILPPKKGEVNYSNIHIHYVPESNLNITVTDRTTWITLAVHVNHDINDLEFEICVDGASFCNLIQASFMDEMSMSVKDKQLVLCSETSSFQLATSTPQLFPVRPQRDTHDKPATFMLTSKELQQALQLVSFSAATDDTSPNLFGIRLKFHPPYDQLSTYGMDNHRVSRVKIPMAMGVDTEMIPDQALLSIKSASALSSLLQYLDTSSDIPLYASTSALEFQIGIASIFIQLISSETIEVDDRINERPDEHFITINADALFSTLRQLSALMDEAKNADVTLSPVTDRAMQFKLGHTQAGEGVIMVPANGSFTGMRPITLDLKLLRNVVSNLPHKTEDTVTFFTNAPNDGVRIVPEGLDVEFVHFLLPRYQSPSNINE